MNNKNYADLLLKGDKIHGFKSTQGNGPGTGQTDLPG